MEIMGEESSFEWSPPLDNAEEGLMFVGKVISKNRVSLTVVRECVKATWKPKGELDITCMDASTNMFAFNFKILEEAQRALQESPWVVKNSLLTLQKKDAYKGGNEIKISTCSFWVQLHNIRQEGRKLSNYWLLGRQIGQVMEVEDPGEGRVVNRNFGRLRIEVDIERPLVSGFYIKRPSIGNISQDPIWIQVGYEKLTKFCYMCGKLGHDNQSCDLDPEELNEVENREKYNAKMCLPPMKSCF